MKWIETKVVFDHPDKDRTVDLISNIFYDFDLQGVVVEDPRLVPAADRSEASVKRPDYHAVIGYIPKDHRAENRVKLLAEQLARLQSKIGLTYSISYQELDEEDWAESWKKYFWPQKIGRHIVVKPTWRDYQAHPDDLVIELDPGMAFGIGSHPTTTLCLELIETYLQSGDSFLDVGTGSGILLLAAAKLGAAMVCGVDQDEVAVEVALKNLRLNAIEPQKFSVKTGDLVDNFKNRYDFVAANILTSVILELLGDVKRVLKPGGILVCSGIMEENQDPIISKMNAIGLEILQIAAKEKWVAIAGRLQP
jgi:ribosomal protein L11 methyltransferase